MAFSVSVVIGGKSCDLAYPSHAAVALWIVGCLAGGTCYRGGACGRGAGDPPSAARHAAVDLDGRHRFSPGRRCRSLSAWPRSRNPFERRVRFWNRDKSSGDAYYASIEPNRKRLEHILGMRDARVPFESPELVGTVAAGPVVGRGNGYRIVAVRWPVIGDVHGEGLLLIPEAAPRADVIAIPDADQSPEMLVGLVPGTAAESQFARRLAENGCRVLVPMLISRSRARRAFPSRVPLPIGLRVGAARDRL